ncbi:MAG: IS630 family transposase [archaeon]|nr:IS630 family transposase [archaeon]
MARPRSKSLQFTNEERGDLNRIASSRMEPAAHIQRAKALLMYERGVPNKDIAQEVGMSTVALSKLVNKCMSIGPLASLDDLPRSGRTAVITDDDKAYIKHIACYKPVDFGYPEELWSQSKLAKHIRENCVKDGYPNLANINKSMVWKFLDEDDIKPFRVRYYLEKRDPKFSEKMKEVLMVYKEVQMAIRSEEETGTVTLSFDEKPGIQAIGNTVADGPATSANGFVKRDPEYVRHGTLSLLAGLNLVTGEVVPLVRESHTSDDFIDFLKIVDGKYADAERIRLVLDNLKVHTSRKVMEYLDTRPNRFVFVFTPKHGSWLNLVESFFGKMVRTLLRGIRVDSKQELIDRIYAYMDEINKDPVVYRWTYKMDEISV